MGGEGWDLLRGLAQSLSSLRSQQVFLSILGPDVGYWEGRSFLGGLGEQGSMHRIGSGATDIGVQQSED